MQTRRAGAPTSDPDSFGSRLRALREAAGLTQDELAERAHLTTHAISALERGTRTRPYPHTIRSLADALGASETDRAAMIAAIASRRKESVAPAAAQSAGRSRRAPAPTTSLVARDAEVTAVATLLRDPQRRLVTLTGIGGVGKTRLGLAAAAAAVPSFPDGAVFVELAPLLDADLVLTALADALGVADQTASNTETAIVESLGDRRLLLVLDNFEHLVTAAPAVVRLVEGCAGLTVLVTSRAALRVRGETEVAVSPLRLPGPHQVDADAVEASPAGALFLDRARAITPGLVLRPDDAAAVADICRRLAGIPLALELAAARTRFLDPATLLARLDEAILADGARDLPARQRTMRAALDWSYGLLDPAEQAMLRLLSVFADGCTLEDVEAVAAIAGTVPRDGVLGLLGALSEQSLVGTVGTGGHSRFQLLEPVAQFGRHMLAAAGESAVVGGAHARHFLDLAERAAPQYQRGEQVAWLARVDGEHANLSAAMEWSIANDRPDDAARLGWALWLYWWLRGHLAHGRRLMETVLERPLSADVRTHAEIAAATMAFAQDDVAASRRWWQSALDRARPAGDVLSQANATAGVGLTALASDDLASAAALFTDAIPLAAAAGPSGEWVGALTEVWLGTVCMLEGDPERAVVHVRQGLASARQRGDRLTIYIGLYNLSQMASGSGDLVAAREHLEEGIRLSTETGDLANLAYFLDALAVVDASAGVHARVPVLVGAAQGIRESTNTKGYGYYRPDEELARRAAEVSREELGADVYDDALDVGRALEPAEAAAFGLTGAGAAV